jgi:four helix bundle protein
MKINKFEDLDIWKESLIITREIYDLTSQPKFSKDFALRDQIRRAVISISSNIVEGFEKNNNNEFIRFLKITKGSIGEVRNQLYIALAASYINDNDFKKLDDKLNKLASQVGAFISYLEGCRSQGQFIKKSSTR